MKIWGQVVKPGLSDVKTVCKTVQSSCEQSVTLSLQSLALRKSLLALHNTSAVRIVFFSFRIE